MLDIQRNYINSAGVTGTRTIDGRRLDSDGLRQSILDLAGFKTLGNWMPDQGGIFRQTNTQLNIETIINNLLDVSTNSTNTLNPGTATLLQWAQYLVSVCDLSVQPDYCISQDVFVPNVQATPNTPTGTPTTGRFCNTIGGKVAIPNTKKLIRQETRLVTDQPLTDQYIPVPNKPCTLGIPRQSQTVFVYSEDYGYTCYGNSDLTGNIIGYDSIEIRETTEAGEMYTTYIQERPDPNCAFTEVEVEYEEDDPANRCNGIIKKDVYRKYADGRSMLHAKGVFVRYFRKMDSDCAPETVKTFHPLNLGSDVISGKVRVNTTGLFNYSQSLDCFNTASGQASATKKYYYEVTDCDSCGRTPYFAVAYGNFAGSGSLHAEGEVNDNATRAIYSQYRLLALDSSETQFSFYTNGVATSSADVYVVNFYRNGLSDRLDPGNFEINLAELTGTAYANNLFTGSNVAVSSSNKVVSLIDNSGDGSEEVYIHDPYVSYDLVSGSLTNGIYTTAQRHTYGIVYPNLGVIVLDPTKLNSELSFNTVTGSNIAGDNAMKLFTSISGSSVLGKHLKARNVKYKTTNHYFVRVTAPLANFSNNPTFVSGSEGYMFHRAFTKNPQTYITTIGLYDDFNRLLAVAKLSRPVHKTFDNDVLFKIRLNW